MARRNLNTMESEAIIKDTKDSYALIHKTRQQAKASNRARHKLFRSTIVMTIGFLIIAIAIVYIFASKTTIACQQTSKANSDRHTPAIVSCEVTRRFLIRPDEIVVPLIPTQGVRLHRSSDSDGDTCNVRLNTLNYGETSLTSYSSSAQCGLHSKVADLNRFIASPQQQTKTSELSYKSSDTDGAEIASFSYGRYWVPVLIGLLLLALCYKCLSSIFKSGLLRGIKFDKRAKTVTFYYVTWSTDYKVCYSFRDVMDVYIRLVEDEDTNEIKVSTHQIKTTDGKKYNIDIRMPLSQEKQAHNTMRRILDLPVNSETQ